ncbi:MAG: LysM peptidoglycan-binding domain-containing protein [Paracoccaceae bacterium]
MSKVADGQGTKTGLILGAVAVAAVAVGTGLYLSGQQSSDQVEGEQLVVQEQPATPEQPATTDQPTTTEQSTTPEEPAKTEQVTTDQEEPTPSDTENVVADTAVAEEEAEAQEEEVASTPPTIDEVRVEEDGLTIVAGRAEPGSVVSIQVDGVENTTVEVDRSGSFAAITFLDPDEDARVLSLVQQTDEEELASLDEVILAPVIPPVVQTEPEADVAVATVGESTSDGAETEGGVQPEVIASDTSEPEQITEQTAEQITEQTAELAEGQSPEFQTDMADLSGADPANVDVANANGAVDSKPELDGSQSALTALQPGLEVAPNVDTTQADPLPELPVTATTTVADVETPAATGEQSPAGVQNVEQPQPAATQSQAELANEATTDPVPQGTTDTPGRVAVLRSTQEGVELLGRQAVIQDNVALDTISYSAEGAVQLAGRANRSAEAVRIYLNNKPIATLEVDPDGRWRGDLPEVDTGVYTLRVDEVSADGAVTSRIQTPFQREDPAVLEAARNQDGKKNAKRVTVQAGDTLWAISRERYGEGLLFVQVFEANRDSIRDANLIFPGQVFDLPD